MLTGRIEAQQMREVALPQPRFFLRCGMLAYVVQGSGPLTAVPVSIDPCVC
jgi:hypothetical protein